MIPWSVRIGVAVWLLMASSAAADVCDSWASAMRYEFIASGATQEAMRDAGTCYSPNDVTKILIRNRILWQRGVGWVHYDNQDQSPDDARRHQGVHGRGDR